MDMHLKFAFKQALHFSALVVVLTVLLKDNVANACNFFAVYECVLSLTSAFRACVLA